MPLPPQTFPPLGDGSIATYDWRELSTGKGYKTFYGTDAVISDAGIGAGEGPTALSLSEEALYSYNYSTVGAAAALDKDFDITFENPQTIQGDIYLNIPMAFYTTIGPVNVSVNLDVKLFKVSGGVETQLGVTLGGDYLRSTPDNSYSWFMFAGKINVADPVVFAQGDSLRLNIISNTPGVSNKFIIFHSPVGFGTTSIILSTILKVHVPFRTNS